MKTANAGDYMEKYFLAENLVYPICSIVTNNYYVVGDGWLSDDGEHKNATDLKYRTSILFSLFSFWDWKFVEMDLICGVDSSFF